MIIYIKKYEKYKPYTGNNGKTANIYIDTCFCVPQDLSQCILEALSQDRYIKVVDTYKISIDIKEFKRLKKDCEYDYDSFIASLVQWQMHQDTKSKYIVQVDNVYKNSFNNIEF